MLKGQMEFIVILGVIVVAAVVIIFASQPAPVSETVPTAVEQEQRAVDEWVTNFMRDVGNNVIIKLEGQGGYWEPEKATQTVPFLTKPVPFWQMCDNSYALTKEQVAGEIEKGVREYMLDGMNESMIVMGKQVTLDLRNFDITANVLDNQVELTAFLPTTISEYRVTKPYRASIPTMYGRVTDFARDYSIDMAERRPFELFTRYSIWLSPSLLPRFGVMDCGVLKMTPSEINDGYKKIVYNLLASIQMWEEPSISQQGPMTFGIDSVNGKTYDDLDIQFRLPDGFAFDAKNPIILSATEPWVTLMLLERIEFISARTCTSPYSIDYSIAYPVVIKTKDTITNENFHFATYVYVEEMENGQCEQTVTLGERPECQNMLCSVNLRVVDYDYQPLEGALATFGTCIVNTSSDTDGIITGPIPCTQADKFELNVYKEEFVPYTRGHFSGDISNPTPKTILLHKAANLSFHFIYDTGASVTEDLVFLKLTSLETGKNYSVGNQGRVTPASIEACIEGRGAADDCDACSSTGEATACETCTTTRAECSTNLIPILDKLNVKIVPGGEYTASATVINPSPPTGKDWYGLPLSTVTVVVQPQIPDESARINVIVPSSVNEYSKADDAYNNRYSDCCDDYYCSCTVHPIHCDDHKDECEAKAIQAAITYITKDFPLKVEVV